jgi:indolepyruvate ferredoxin oxidoreductase
MERALITEFEQLLDELLRVLNADNVAAAASLVRQFLDIRGYGPVKEESVLLVREQIKTGLRELFEGNQKAA